MSKHQITHILILFPLLIISQIVSAQTPKGTIQWLGRGIIPTLVSADGRVMTGLLSTSDNAPFRWDDKHGLQMLQYLNPNFPSGSGADISADGSVIVGSATRDTMVLDGNIIPLRQAVRWDAAGSITALPSLGRGMSWATGIDASGTTIVGEFDSTYIGTEHYSGNLTLLNAPLAGRWDRGIPALLPGINGSTYTYASGISPDGSVVMGNHNSASNAATVAAKWTSAGGFDLGFTWPPYSQAICSTTDGSQIFVAVATPNPQATYRVLTTGARTYLGDSTEPTAVSADGRRLIGRSIKAGWTGVIWDNSTTPQKLQAFCKSKYGIDTTGIVWMFANDISADGSVIVGNGIDSTGVYQGFRLLLDKGDITVWKPAKGDLWLPETTDTIRWTCFKRVDTVDVLFSPDSGATQTLIASGIPGDSGSIAWTVPAGTMSHRCMITIVEHGGPTHGASGIFKIKGTYLTHFGPTGNYEKFEQVLHGYQFPNGQEYLWPQSWWQRYHYSGGIDEITGLKYPTSTPFPTAVDSVFPSWPIWVKTFGQGICYFNMATEVPRKHAADQWSATADPWGGSCQGMALTSLLAFDNQGTFRSSFPEMPEFSVISTLPCDEHVRTVISELYTAQFGAAHTAYRDAQDNTVTPTQTVQDLRKMFLEDKDDDRILAIRSNDPAHEGGHAIVPYKLEHDGSDANIYWIYVYDNAYPGETGARIRVDTTANGGNGSWTYDVAGDPDYPYWGGPKHLFLKEQSSLFLAPPDLPKISPINIKKQIPGILSLSSPYEVFQRGAGSIVITDMYGNQTGYRNDSTLSGIPGAFPRIREGRPTGAPRSYALPPGSYTVDLGNFTDTAASCQVFGDSTEITYSRHGIQAGDHDILTFSGRQEIMVMNDRPLARSFGLELLVEEPAAEKLYSTRNIILAPGDTLRVSTLNHDQLQISHPGSGEISLNLEIETRSRDGSLLFTKDSIPLAANSGNIIIPDWTRFATDTTLRILIDHGNDGSIDDSIIVRNQTVNPPIKSPGSILSIDNRTWGTDGGVLAIAKSGSTVYIGGNFQTVGPVTGSAAVLDRQSGLTDPAFPKFDGTVYCIAPDGNGGCYLGGSYTKAGIFPITNLAHVLTDNTLDTSWHPSPNNTVYALAVANGVVYAGGDFSSIGGASRSMLAAIDGVTGTATAWNPGVDNRVLTVAVRDSIIYAGGWFLNAGGQQRHHIAAIGASGGLATAWDPNADGVVTTIIPTETSVFAAGSFFTIGGQSRTGIARLNRTTSLADAWNAQSNYLVATIALSGGTLYAGGHFYQIGGQSRNALAAIDTATALSTAWHPVLDGDVAAIAVSNGSIHIAGTFTNAGGQSRLSIAAIDSASGTATGWYPATDGTVTALSASGDRIYACGEFAMIGGVRRRNIAAIDAATGRATAWDPSANNTVLSLVINGSSIYAGGSFTSIGGQTRNHCASLDPATGLANGWNPNFNGNVTRLTTDGVKIYAAGLFSKIGSITRNLAAAFDGAAGSLAPWNPNPDGTVLAIAVDGGTVYLGGQFSTLDSLPRLYCGAVDTALGVPTNWTPSPNGTVYALAAGDHMIYAGGNFTTIGGQSRRYAGALDPITGQALSWNPNPNSRVSLISPAGSTVYLGGEFSTMGGQMHQYISGVDALSGMATAWSAAFSNSVTALFTSGQLICIGGDFTTVNSMTAPHFTTFIDSALITGIRPQQEKNNLPKEFVLGQNYPNPFNPVTNLTFTLKVWSKVQLKIYDILGREVGTLVDGPRQPGVHTVQWNAGNYASGVYFYRLVAVSLTEPGSQFSSVRKMLLLR